MTIAGVITLGIGPGGSVPLLLTVGYWDDASPAADAVVATRRKNAGPAPFSYVLPPHKKLKKRKRVTIEEVRELYQEAIELVPLEAQSGLLPIALRTEGRGTQILPPADVVDFEALARSLDVIKSLIAAVEYAAKVRREEEERVARIKRDDETIVYLLLHS